MLHQRVMQPELMDAPTMGGAEHALALRGLARINALSGSARILWSALAELERASHPRPLRLLDLATGAGDVPIRLWHKARRTGLALEIAGCDRSASAVDFAQQRALECGAEVRFFQEDALEAELPDGYDAIMCSLFLHHLTDHEAERLLQRMANAAGRLVLVNDLRRSAFGLLLAAVGSRLLSRSPVVHTDGPLSVRAAFTIAEVRALAERAGLGGAVVARRWPCRWLLTWRRP